MQILIQIKVNLKMYDKKGLPETLTDNQLECSTINACNKYCTTLVVTLSLGRNRIVPVLIMTGTRCGPVSEDSLENSYGIELLRSKIRVKDTALN